MPTTTIVASSSRSIHNYVQQIQQKLINQANLFLSTWKSIKQWWALWIGSINAVLWKQERGQNGTATQSWRTTIFGTVISSHGESWEIVGLKSGTGVKMARAGKTVNQISTRMRCLRRPSDYIKRTSDHHNPTEHWNWKYDQRSTPQTGNAKISLLHQRRVPKSHQEGGVVSTQ